MDNIYLIYAYLFNRKYDKCACFTAYTHEIINFIDLLLSYLKRVKTCKNGCKRLRQLTAHYPYTGNDNKPMSRWLFANQGDFVLYPWN